MHDKAKHSNVKITIFNHCWFFKNHSLIPHNFFHLMTCFEESYDEKLIKLKLIILSLSSLPSPFSLSHYWRAVCSNCSETKCSNEYYAFNDSIFFTRTKQKYIIFHSYRYSLSSHGFSSLTCCLWHYLYSFWKIISSSLQKKPSL